MTSLDYVAELISRDYVAEPTLAGVTGQFFMDSKPRKSKPITHDPAVAAQLWQLSSELTALPASQLAG